MGERSLVTPDEAVLSIHRISAPGTVGTFRLNKEGIVKLDISRTRQQLNEDFWTEVLDFGT